MSFTKKCYIKPGFVKFIMKMAFTYLWIEGWSLFVAVDENQSAFDTQDTPFCYINESKLVYGQIQVNLLYSVIILDAVGTKLMQTLFYIQRVTKDFGANWAEEEVLQAIKHLDIDDVSLRSDSFLVLQNQSLFY